MAARRRLEAGQARVDTREWVVNRRERTRQLIELGGLVVKAGLVDLTNDDRAVLYGSFLAVADRLKAEDRERALLLWQRRGRRAFAQDGGVEFNRAARPESQLPAELTGPSVDRAG